MEACFFFGGAATTGGEIAATVEPFAFKGGWVSSPRSKGVSPTLFLRFLSFFLSAGWGSLFFFEGVDADAATADAATEKNGFESSPGCTNEE